MEEKFSAIFRRNTWNDPDSISGPGSTLRETVVVREGLPRLIERIGARSLLDIPCGDFNWMRQVPLDLDQYIGADVVGELVEANRRQFEDDRRTFVKLDVTRDALPRVDLIFSRDCLVHFSFDDIFLALKNMVRSGSRYLLTTTFPATQWNEDIVTGQWHRLNFEKPPFGFPAPLESICEQCPKEDASDKSLGLWRLADIGAVLTAEQRRQPVANVPPS